MIMSNDDVFGFDELKKAFDKMEQKFPDKTDAMLSALAKTASTKTRAKTPIGKTKKLRGSWRVKKPKKYGSSRVVRWQSTARHAHLVEQGHEIIRGGSSRRKGKKLNTFQRTVRGIQSKGRVEGKKMIENTVKEMESAFEKSAQKLLDELTKDVEL